jgi:hypothetical protein
MNTVNVLEALVANLEASHRIAVELLQSAQDDATEQHLDAIGSLVKAFGGKKESAEAETDAAKTDTTATETDTATQTSVDEAAPVKPTHEVLMEMLNDERYTLRTAKSLIEKSGFSGDADALAEYFDDNLVDVVRLNRRSDGAEVFGLADRN